MFLRPSPPRNSTGTTNAFRFLTEEVAPELDGPIVVKVTVAVTDPLFARFTEAGEIEHPTLIRFPSLQTRLTVLFWFVEAATFTVNEPVCPAVSVRVAGFDVMEKSGRFTVTNPLVVEADP